MRVTSFVPFAAPLGRALVKEPPAYTVLPMTIWLQTTPLIWGAGSASLVTVAGSVPVGAVSA